MNAYSISMYRLCILKRDGNGMATSPLYLKEASDRTATSPFYIKGNGRW